MKEYSIFSICPKCESSSGASTKWKKKGTPTNNYDVMERTCINCGFSWDEKPLDTKDAK